MSIYTTLIEAEQLFENYTHPKWVIVDCRFDLANPDWGFLDYQTAHIPGSVYAHLDYDLSGSKTSLNGRHPLPDPLEFCQRIGKLGISNDSQVIVLDTVGGSFCSRLWWMLRWLGHQAVAVLNGGLSAWKSHGYPVNSGIEMNPPAQFHGQPDSNCLVSTKEIRALISDSNYKLLDARTPARHRGEIEPYDILAGRIPGSMNRFHENNLLPDGRLKPAATLRSEFTQLLANTPPENVIVYCGSGVTACHHLLAMESAGIPGAKLYAGSWSEWIRDPNNPTEKG